MSNETKTTGLLDRLSQEFGCEFLSDLKSMVFQRRTWAVQLLQKIEAEEYSVEEWNDTHHYLLGQPASYRDAVESRNALTEKLKQK